MIIYNYDGVNHAYLNSSEADPDPLNPGNFLIPANATEVAPPEAPAGQTPVWQDDHWELVASDSLAPPELMPTPVIADQVQWNAILEVSQITNQIDPFIDSKFSVPLDRAVMRASMRFAQNYYIESPLILDFIAYCNIPIEQFRITWNEVMSYGGPSG